MNGFFIWLYGAVCISSGVIGVSWGTAALRFRRRHARFWYHSPVLVAVALAIGAGALASIAGYRTFDAAILHRPATGSEPAFLVAGWALLLISQFLLVRAAHIDTQTFKIRNGWRWFLIVMGIWIAAVLALV